MEEPSSNLVSSPDMFESDSDYDKNKSPQIEATPKKFKKQLTKEELIIKSDIYLMKKMNESLGGIPPPPKYTIYQNDCENLLQKIKNNSNYFYINDPFNSLNNNSSQNSINSINNKDVNLGIFQTINDEKKLQNLTWPLAFKEKAFGIHYNRNKYVEYIENKTINLCDRYICCDTQSTFTTCSIDNNNTKKKLTISKRSIGQSPGKRLSHLAKRRSIFSIANLKNMNDKSSHCLINVKKSIMKKSTSPRKINKKSPNILSTKKLTTRRWSVQSSGSWKLKTPPCCLAHNSPLNHQKSSSIKKTYNNYNQQYKTQNIKRSLFTSPIKIDKITSQLKLPNDDLNKHNYNENDHLKLKKKLSFDCSNNLNKISDKQTTNDDKIKTKSTTKIGSNKMDDIDRKKLVWAVSQALRLKGIDTTHEKFQYYGRQLVKKVKESMPYLENHDIPRKPGSTTERMLSHAKKYAFLLVDDRQKI